MIWKDLFKYPPRYYYDAKTRTLGLDGHWSGVYKQETRVRTLDISLEVNDEVFYRGAEQLNVYLGDNFDRDPYSGSITPLLFSKSYVTVSPKNEAYSSFNGILISKQDKKPVLEYAGEGFYKIARNGKWGIINDELREVVPLKYDFVCQRDSYGHFLVRHDEGRDMKFGLVNKHGVELLPPIYDTITLNDNGTYIVRREEEEFVMDKNGQRQMTL